MSRQFKAHLAILLAFLTVFTGCHPTQPFYFHEDGDLSHYLDHATAIEYPDVELASLAEVTQAAVPRTISTPDFKEIWDLSLEEVVSITMQNSQVIRNLGAVTQIGFADPLIGRTGGASTIYDPAINQTLAANAPHPVDGGSGSVIPAGSDPTPRAQQIGGVEDALSEFDAQFFSSAFYQTQNRPRNLDPTNPFVSQFLATQSQNLNQVSTISKRMATGGVVSLRNRNDYSRSNQESLAVPSFWTAALEVEYQQPLLRGRGTQINRIPIVLARINEDINLATFESSVKNLVLDVETAYWNLYFAYRNLEANTIGRDSALGIWRLTQPQAAELRPVQEEAQAREQVWFFSAQLQIAQRDLFNAETRLRFLMGLSPTDHRLIRPSDDPTKARVDFDWHSSLAEALYRSPELRQQKWAIKQRELELIAARNQLLPRLNATVLYRQVGLGDELINADRNGLNFPAEGSTAYDNLTEGRFGEYAVGLDFLPPRFGARRQLSGVRNAELSLIREKVRLEDMELQQTHLLTTAFTDLDLAYHNAGAHMNRLVAAESEVNALEAIVAIGAGTLDLVLDAQRRQTQAMIDYYRSLTEYNQSIAEVHFFKGTLLEYDSIALAEGPWPKKAYWDALERARERDASYYLDYGWTRPNVVSRGPVSNAPIVTGEGFDGLESDEYSPERIPTPQPTPADAPNGAETPDDTLPAPGPVTRRSAGSANEPALGSADGKLSGTPLDTFHWGALGFEETPLTSINPLRQASLETTDQPLR